MTNDSSNNTSLEACDALPSRAGLPSFDPSQSEIGYVLAVFGRAFEPLRNKRLLLHGTRAYAQAIIEAFGDRFNFVGIVAPDRDESVFSDTAQTSDSSQSKPTFCGLEVIAESEMLDRHPDIVILTERVRHAEDVYQRIAQSCRERGVGLVDMYGLDWLSVRPQIDAQVPRTMAEWLDSALSYDVVSFELPDVVLTESPWSQKDLLVVRPAMRQLVEQLNEAGKTVLFIGRGPYSELLLRDSLAASHLVPPHRSLDDAFFMRQGEDGAWRTIRSRYPNRKILHIGYGIAKECILPRYYGVDTYRFSHAKKAPVAARSFEREVALACLDPQELKHSIAHAIENAHVVSFDVFDTLLERTVSSPEEVFLLVEKTAAERGLAAVNFAAERASVQAMNGHATLAELYRALQAALKLDDAARDELMHIEMEIERQVVRPRASVCELMRDACAARKHVYLVSDMYLPRETLAQLLEDNGIRGYEKLIVSCDERQLKTEGLLCNVVKDVDRAWQAVHIGNSIEADLEPALNLGMQAFLVPSAADLAASQGAISTAVQPLSTVPKGSPQLFSDAFEPRPVKVRAVGTHTAEAMGADSYPTAKPASDAESAFFDKSCATVADFDFRMPVELRRGLLAWYPFEQGASALFLGSDTEAFVDTLKEHFAFVDTELDPAKRYDAIVVLDVLEPACTFETLLHRLASALTRNGVLIIGARNKFGLKYLCGGIDNVATQPFSAFDRLLGREEVRNIAKRAGFSFVKPYSIMPDSGFTQAVYTDEYTPSTGIRDRVLPYDSFDSPLVANEHDLYEGVVEEGLLTKFASYYLFECRISAQDDVKPHVVHATLSLDRGEEHAFVTTLFYDGTVSKRAVSPAGIPCLQALFEHGEQLRACGIATVEQKLHSDRMTMPLVQEKPLLNYIAEQIPRSPARIIEVFEKIYGDVLKSSSESKLDDDSVWLAYGVDPRTLGPILSEAFIDMVPYNAFWHQDRPLYFDQEFTMLDCPAKFVLFRAIHYTWIHLPAIEQAIPLETMKRQFGLTANWHAFLKAEQAFVGDIRNHDRFEQLYSWADFNEEAAQMRRDVLMGTTSHQSTGPVTGSHARAQGNDSLTSRANVLASDERPYGIGLVMGVFDLLHIGHLRLFKRAKQRCRYLRVGVMSDALVQKYKNIKPTIPQDQRMELIAAIADVDEVFLIEDNPSRIMEWYRRPFDCFFSGDDYADDEYWKQEREELRKLGSNIEFFSYTKEQSSTNIRRSLG